MMAKEPHPLFPPRYISLSPFLPFFYKKQKTERQFFLTLIVVDKVFGLHFLSFQN